MTKRLDEAEAAAVECAMGMLRSRLKWGTKHFDDDAHARSSIAASEMSLRFLRGEATDEDREAVGEVLARLQKDIAWLG